MNKFSLLALISVFSMAVGCAESPSKTKDQADETVAVIKSTSASINAMGTPSASWSDAELTKLKDLLSDMQKQTTQARAYTGKLGSIVGKSVNFDQIDRATQTKWISLQQAQEAKTRQTTQEQRVEKLRVLEVQKAYQVQALFKLGEPSSAWTTEMLNQYTAQIDQIEKTVDAQVVIEGETESSKSTRESLKGLREVGYLRKATTR